jgi:hypothetical protein
MVVLGEQSVVDEFSELVDGFVGFNRSVGSQRFSMYIVQREKQTFLFFRFTMLGEFCFNLFEHDYELKLSSKTLKSKVL